MAQLNLTKTAQLHQTPGKEHLNYYEELGPNGEIIESYIATHPRFAQVASAGPIGSEPVVPGAPPEDIPVDPIAQLVPPMGGWVTDPNDPNWGNPAFMAPEGHPSHISPDTWYSVKRDYDQEQYQIQNEADDALAREQGTFEEPVPWSATDRNNEIVTPDDPNWGNFVADHPIQGPVLEAMWKAASAVSGGLQGIADQGAPVVEAVEPWLEQGNVLAEDFLNTLVPGSAGPQDADAAADGNGGTSPPYDPALSDARAREFAAERAAAKRAEAETERAEAKRAETIWRAEQDDDNDDSGLVYIPRKPPEPPEVDPQAVYEEDDDAEGGLVKRNPNEYAKGGVVKRKGYSSPQPVGMANGGPSRWPNVTAGTVGRPSPGARPEHIGPPNSDLSGVGVNVEFPFGPADASRVESLGILGGSSRGTPPPIDTPASLVQRTDSELVSTAPEEEEEEEVASPPFQADVDIDTGEPPPPNVTNGAYNQNMDDFYMQDGGKVEQTDDTVTLTHDQIKALANKLYSEFEGRQRDFDKGEKYLRFIDVNGNNIPSSRPMADGGPIRVDEESLVDRKPTDTPMPPGTEEEIGVADDLPRNLSEGEFVIPAHVVKHFGENFFNDLIGSVKPPKALMKKKPV